MFRPDHKVESALGKYKPRWGGDCGIDIQPYENPVDVHPVVKLPTYDNSFYSNEMRNHYNTRIAMLLDEETQWIPGKSFATPAKRILWNLTKEGAYFGKYIKWNEVGNRTSATDPDG